MHYVTQSSVIINKIIVTIVKLSPVQVSGCQSALPLVSLLWLPSTVHANTKWTIPNTVTVVNVQDLCGGDCTDSVWLPTSLVAHCPLCHRLPHTPYSLRPGKVTELVGIVTECPLSSDVYCTRPPWPLLLWCYTLNT